MTDNVRRIKVRKEVVIYHPTVLIAEVGSVFKIPNGILFGRVNGDRMILDETHNPEEFREYFDVLPEPRPPCIHLKEDSWWQPYCDLGLDHAEYNACHNCSKYEV